MPSEAYDEVNKAWKSTTRVLFGEELGELKDYAPYLKEALIGKWVDSCFSGKKLWVASEEYHEKARFFDYQTEGSKVASIAAKPIDINSIKDLDSLLEAVQEKLIYSGNKALGNSQHVEDSDAIVDSVSILNSSNIVRSRYLAYAYLMRENEYTFGSTSSGQSSHIIRCFYNNTLKRCFECCTSISSSDCYFSYNLLGCTNCMFTFNARSKKDQIGNVQLNRQQYDDLKNKLVGEMRDMLKKKKRFDPSIVDFLNS